MPYNLFNVYIIPCDTIELLYKCKLFEFAFKFICLTRKLMRKCTDYSKSILTKWKELIRGRRATVSSDFTRFAAHVRSCRCIRIIALARPSS